MSRKHFSVRFNRLFSLLLQYATNMPSTRKWKQPRLLLSKSVNREVYFQVIIKHLIRVKVFFIVVHDLLHFQSILNVFRLRFHEETTPQSLRLLESSTTFDRQKFLHICASRKLIRYPKALQIRKTSVYARIWIPFWSDKQR